MAEELRITHTQAKNVWDKVFGVEYTVVSFDIERSAEGVKYLIKHKGTDEWGCNCQSFIYHSGVETVKDLESGKKYKDTCKHIRHCMKKEGMKIKTGW